MPTTTKKTVKKAIRKTYAKKNKASNEKNEKSNQEKVNEILAKIIDIFSTGTLPEKIAYTKNPSTGIPCQKWSIRNQILVALAGTEDARTFLQWKDVGRYPKSSAFYVLKPRFYSKEVEKDGKKEKKMFIGGFITKPVFRYEDTEGDPLILPEMPKIEFPLLEVAKKWGIKVEHISGNDYRWRCYRPNESKIQMATTHESVFFHELAHAAHDKLGLLKPIDQQKNEIVAELSAQALSLLCGKETQSTLGNSYQYIKRYCSTGNIERECMAVISDVDKVLNLILGERETQDDDSNN